MAEKLGLLPILRHRSIHRDIYVFVLGLFEGDGDINFDALDEAEIYCRLMRVKCEYKLNFLSFLLAPHNSMLKDILD